VVWATTLRMFDTDRRTASRGIRVAIHRLTLGERDRRDRASAAGPTLFRIGLMNQSSPASSWTSYDSIATVYQRVALPWFTPIAADLIAAVNPHHGDTVLDLGTGRHPW